MEKLAHPIVYSLKSIYDGVPKYLLLWLFCILSSSKPSLIWLRPQNPLPSSGGIFKVSLHKLSHRSHLVHPSFAFSRPPQPQIDLGIGSYYNDIAYCEIG